MPESHAPTDSGTVRALLCDAFGTPAALRIGGLPHRKLGAGEVRIRVHAAVLSFADGLITAGAYQVKPALPFVPGACGAGEVIEIADGVTAVARGEMVTFFGLHGACAQEIVCDAGSVMAASPGLAPEQAAIVRLFYPPVYFALNRRAALQAGETLFVTGAGGASGIAAVKLGKRMGARVIAGASTRAGLTRAAEAGADHGVNYASETLKDVVAKLTDGRGVDVAFDMVGGDLFDQCARCMAEFGRLVVFGFASGDIPLFKVNRALLKNYAVVGANFGSWGIGRNADQARAIMAVLNDWASAGALGGDAVTRFDLDDAAQAVEAVRRKENGTRIVVRI
jgi:NADPH2:quinone reductase